jgi:aspartate-semialdehyde dehydrogenase
VVGATASSAATCLSILEQRAFPVGEGSRRGERPLRGSLGALSRTELPVQDLETFDFSKVHIGLFSAGASVSRCMRCGRQGWLHRIDNTSQFRYQDDIPLVVTEVNPHAIAGYRKHNIIANPNCSTMQMLVALKPLHDVAQIERINVATYQSVPARGRRRSTSWISARGARRGEAAVPKVIAKQIAFNCVPQIDVFLDNGYTKEEMKMFWETQKIMEDPRSA